MTVGGMGFIPERLLMMTMMITVYMHWYTAIQHLFAVVGGMLCKSDKPSIIITIM